ncbi:MAG: TIGR04063 family PEP-CTERM/XrtA system glycosyltransferase [Thermodesulfobacteriota bacterium]
MNVLHVLNDSIPRISGYSSRAYAIVSEQARLGMHPVVVTSVRQGPTSEAVESIDGIPYYRTTVPARLAPGMRHIGPLGIGIEMMLLERRIRSILRRESIDIVHAHSPVLCAFPAWFAARKAGLPFVYEIRAFWEDAAVDRGRTREGDLRYRLTRGLETAVIRRADRIVVICEGLKQDIVARGAAAPSAVHVVRNGVNVHEFTPQPKDRALAGRLGLEDAVVIGFVGTFYAFEGLPLLIEALERLMEDHPRLFGLIVGYGQTEAELKRRTASSRFRNRLLLPGKVPRDQVAAYYSLIDVCVYPRERRRITELVTPLKPLEAMAMQKVVVASDVGGLRELVREGENGFLFRAGDACDLVRVLNRLLEMRRMWPQLGAGARHSVIDRHRWDGICEEYRRIYAVVHRRREGETL